MRDILLNSDQTLAGLEDVNRKSFAPDNVEILALDMCDEMVNRGFREQISRVRQALKPTTQVILNTDTMSPELKELTAEWMHDDVLVVREVSVP